MERETEGALGLLSGGLDSQLAVRLLQRQGITVRAIVFDHPFYDITPAREAAEALSIPLRIHDFTSDILDLLESPPHGFGSCMNPCIDCHARMLRRAGERLGEEGCRFLFTGEVLNERPMSQTRRALETVAKASGFADRILRPLSARLLPPTRPEREGWVDRDRLLDFNGRRRTAQLALAADFGLRRYPSPAGGCLLTEPNFRARLQDLRDHEGWADRRWAWRLRIGRHFRLASGSRLWLGRDAGENDRIEAAADPGTEILLLPPDGQPGPTGLLPDHAPETDRIEAAAILAAYAKCPVGADVRIPARHRQREIPPIPTRPLPPDAITRLRIG